MPELTVDIDFEVWCDKCGAGLCLNTRVEGNKVSVEPCERCLQEAYEEGYWKAKEESENG